MKKKHSLNQGILAVSCAFLLWSIVWVEERGALTQPSVSSIEEQSEPYIHTTSIADALFLDEWMQGLRVDGQPFQKQVIDKPAYRKHLPASYTLLDDPFTVSKVQFNQKGTGVQLKVTTPTLFTHVTFKGFQNVIATAGIKDVSIELLSPAETSGINALAGIYGYFATTEQEAVRMTLAHEEMYWIVKFMTRYNPDVESPNRMNRALAEMKMSLNPYNQRATKGSLHQTVTTRWQRNDLPDLSKEDENGLVDWLDRYQNSVAITDKETRRQLETIAN